MGNQRFCNTVEAKARLNEFLDEVVGGQEVIIQRRGKVVARLVPATENTLDAREETLRFMTQLKAFHKRHKRKCKPAGSIVALLREIRRES